MDNKDFNLLFDETVKTNIKGSFDDVNMSLDLKSKIKSEVIENKSIIQKLSDILNYEVEIPVGRLAVVAAILAIIPTSFTINEGRKIMKNNINIHNDIVLAENSKIQK